MTSSSSTCEAYAILSSLKYIYSHDIDKALIISDALRYK